MLYFYATTILKLSVPASSSYSFSGGCRPHRGRPLLPPFRFSLQPPHSLSAFVRLRWPLRAAPHANRLFNLKPSAEKIHFVQMHFLCSSNFHVRLNCFLYVKDLSWNLFHGNVLVFYIITSEQQILQEI